MPPIATSQVCRSIRLVRLSARYSSACRSIGVHAGLPRPVLPHVGAANVPAGGVIAGVVHPAPARPPKGLTGSPSVLTFASIALHVNNFDRTARVGPCPVVGGFDAGLGSCPSAGVDIKVQRASGRTDESARIAEGRRWRASLREGGRTRPCWVSASFRVQW